MILSNGGYAVMDRLAEQQGGTGPWPTLRRRRRRPVARARLPGADDRRRTASCSRTLDEVLPSLGDRSEPLLLEVKVAPDESFSP